MATMQLVLFSSTCSLSISVPLENKNEEERVHGMLWMQEKRHRSCTNVNCRDMKKFGGQGKKQKCIHRVCTRKCCYKGWETYQGEQTGNTRGGEQTGNTQGRRTDRQHTGRGTDRQHTGPTPKSSQLNQLKYFSYPTCTYQEFEAKSLQYRATLERLVQKCPWTTTTTTTKISIEPD